MMRIVSLSLALTIMSCVANEKEFSDTVNVASLASKRSSASIGVKPSKESITYSYEQANYRVETVTCSIQASSGQVLIVNDGISAFTDNFCKSDIAQAFFSHGLAVIALNLPGTGESSGDYDLGGAQSQESIVKVATSIQKQLPLVGLMGSYIGGIAAAQAAKKLPDLKFLILGSTIFDLEAAYSQTTDQNLRRYVERLAQNGDLNTVFEPRSVMWDPTGLPGSVLLFHGGADLRVSSEQARSFRDTLATQQKMVQLKIVDELSGPLSDGQQSVLIERFLRK